MDKDKNIKILMCGNRCIFKGVILTSLSLAKYSREKITLYIGTMDLSDVDERFLPMTEEQRQIAEAILKSANEGSRAILVDFTSSFRRELIHSKNMGTGYTPYTMVRLFADEINEISDKLLYLDTDIMFLGDVKEIYDLNVEDFHIAGSRDFFGKFFFSPSYLNAGVLLFNMKKMREDDIFKKCRRLCNDKKMLLSDQHAINRYAKRKLILNRRFNEQHKTFDNTLIRHFAMTIKWLPFFHTETVKPWQPELIHKRLGDRRFDDILELYERNYKNL